MYVKCKCSIKMVIVFEGIFFVEDENLYSIFCLKVDDIFVKLLIKNYVVCF